MGGGIIDDETKQELSRLMLGRSYDELLPHEKGMVLGAAKKQQGREAESHGRSEPPPSSRPQHMGKIIR
ncbi:hypothetical protein CHLRE_01g031400v5 [Chlamydomonas reinhardtii]|uniref:Uncharacterized protein n=1 Tax=Chlamydomonas reinhardtii TaxID=3055 RepID=A8HQK3_CHLRE|nr:uncharacterized protein CHLRE_01g031400v5 [Chlamydomonas reinhardtii]PNW88479.1 hypothetical protein CHLRE_01g031400v5 [Chlamydomonas reinhardtii]|eukprot:XP_001689591.1 predicted protein [Chlamydomonas reinhardtii]